MKIVCRTEPQKRCSNRFCIRFKPSVLLNSETSPWIPCFLSCGSNGQGSWRNPDRPQKGRRFDSTVSASNVHRQIASHRMTIDSDPVAIDFRLSFQKSNSSPAALRQQIPVIVSRRHLAIERIGGWLEIEIPWHIILSRSTLPNSCSRRWVLVFSISRLPQFTDKHA